MVKEICSQDKVKSWTSFIFINRKKTMVLRNHERYPIQTQYEPYTTHIQSTPVQFVNWHSLGIHVPHFSVTSTVDVTVTCWVVKTDSEADS